MRRHPKAPTWLSVFPRKKFAEEELKKNCVNSRNDITENMECANRLKLGPQSYLTMQQN